MIFLFFFFQKKQKLQQFNQFMKKKHRGKIKHTLVRKVSAIFIHA